MSNLSILSKLRERLVVRRLLKHLDAGTVMGEVVVHNMIDGASVTVVGWVGFERGRDHKIFHGASITVVGRHGYGRGRGP